MGYHRAGFDVIGVDNCPQPHYPFSFYQADALEFLATHGQEYDVIHASPPCQEYSKLKGLKTKTYPDLVDPIRIALKKTGRPWIIENVPGAPLQNALTLCGSMFGLGVRRHRLFECNPQIAFAPFTCNHNKKIISVVGSGYIAREGRAAMGIDWMTKKELSQAIPLAYTEYIGRTLLRLLSRGPDGRSV